MGAEYYIDAEFCDEKGNVVFSFNIFYLRKQWSVMNAIENFLDEEENREYIIKKEGSETFCNPEILKGFYCKALQAAANYDDEMWGYNLDNSVSIGIMRMLEQLATVSLFLGWLEDEKENTNLIFQLMSDYEIREENYFKYMESGKYTCRLNFLFSQ